MSTIKSLQGLVALVTGGASGLGLASVERFIQQGAKVVFCDLPMSNGPDVVARLGPDAIFAPADITVESEIKDVLSVVQNSFGKLDAIVNCAGIGLALKMYNFHKNVPHSFEDFEKVQKVNTFGTFNVIRLGVGLMGKNIPDDDGYRGVVINTASIAAFDGQRGQAAYSASKAAIIGMTLPIARDLAPQGIRCCTIAPGIFNTPLLEKLPDSVKSNLADSTPFPKRLGQAVEYAHLVQFLVENPMMNAAVIRLDGALRMQP